MDPTQASTPTPVAGDSKTKELVTKNLPWSKDAKWPVVAIQAVALLGIGIYMLVWTDEAADIALQLIGVVFLVTSVMLGLARYRNEAIGLGFIDAFRSGVGAACGAIATVSWWSDYVDNYAVRMILGWGLIAYSVLHLVGIVTVRGRGGLRLSTLVTVGLTLVLGIVLLTGDDTNSDGRIQFLGIVFLVFGALLGALTYYLYSKASKGEAGDAGAVAA